MNPSDLFKASLGTAASALAPTATGLFQLGSSLFGNKAAPQTTAPTPTLQSSVPSNSFSSPNQSRVPSTAGGNSSATSPKESFVASQVNNTPSLSGASATGGSAAPATNTVYNPNANYYGGQNNTTGASSNPSLDTYKSSFDTYLKSLLPSDAETGAEKTLADLQLQAKKDQDYALDRPGQTLGFAAGEAQRVNRNNSYGIDAASNALNSLTGARTARTNATKAQLDFEKGLYDDSIAAAKPDYQTVSPGSTVFDPKTGKAVYTAPTTASQNPTGGSGSYIAGTDPVADGWVTAINNNQAKLSDVPAAYKSSVAQGLAAAGKDDALKTNALTSAQQLLTSFNNSGGVFGIGGSKQAVGGSSILPVIPGTQTADFVANLDNLKSLLSLDNVKYLKGQGAVSDAERKLLADSATQLNRAQSEDQFKATLQKIIDGLQKFGGTASGAAPEGGDADYQSYLKAIGAQ